MDCNEFNFLVHAYVDDELDERERVETEVHLGDCDTCRGQARRVSRFRQALRESYEPESAPDALKMRLVAALEAQSEVEAQQAAVDEIVAGPAPAVDLDSMREASRAPRPWASRWLLGGGGFAAAAAAALLVTAVWSGGADKTAGQQPAGPMDRAGVAAVERTAHPNMGYEPIVRESVSWHRRQVPIEITGPDDARVNHWFQGKVDFKVKTPRFDRRGNGDVNLLGARLSNVREKQAAYVVYEVDGSKVSVLIFDRHEKVPDSTARAGERGFYNAGGYNVAVVEDQGVTYSITSDLSREDHVQLVNAAFRPK
jgi:anti-sigma factor RsiW